MTPCLSRTMKADKFRAPDRIREQYHIERELADRLRQAPPEERGRLYAMVYDELFRLVPYHSQLIRKVVPASQRRDVRNRMRWLRRFLRPEMTFLEIGAGDCSLAFCAAENVRRVIAMEVSVEITRQSTHPANFELLLLDGFGTRLNNASVHMAYSDQFFEHLHPDDAVQHLRDIYQALVPGGRYVCITPNRLGGPWDISRYFDPVATGLHLKEYTFTELESLFRQAGFRKMRPYVGGRGYYLPFSARLFRWMERLLASQPPRRRRRLTDNPVMQVTLGIQLIAEKG